MIAKINQLTQPYIEVFITKPFVTSPAKMLNKEFEVLYQLEVSKVDPYTTLDTTSSETSSSKDYLQIIYIVIPAVLGIIIILILLIAIWKIKKKKSKKNIYKEKPTEPIKEVNVNPSKMSNNDGCGYNYPNSEGQSSQYNNSGLVIPNSEMMNLNSNPNYPNNLNHINYLDHSNNLNNFNHLHNLDHLNSPNNTNFSNYPINYQSPLSISSNLTGENVKENNNGQQFTFIIPQTSGFKVEAHESYQQSKFSEQMVLQERNPNISSNQAFKPSIPIKPLFNEIHYESYPDIPNGDNIPFFEVDINQVNEYDPNKKLN